MNIYNN